jgi:hypothetical protein
MREGNPFCLRVALMTACLSRRVAVALSFVVLSACSAPLTGLEAPPEASQSPLAASAVGTVPAGFAEAIQVEDVPLEILLAISQVESSLQMVVGESEFEGQEPAFGLMGLRGQNLVLGAELAGLEVEEVKSDRTANVLAAAALLSEWAAEMGIDRTQLGAWAPVVARYSGIEDPEAQAEYVHYEVFGVMTEGLSTEGFELKGQDVDAEWPVPARGALRLDDQGSIWTPSPNHNARSGSPVFVVIHTCEGAYSGCWSWLTNSSSGVSAHYVVNSTGSEVRQLVAENRRAWHASANYDCDLNGDRECSRDGTSMNTLGVGIEHAGYSSQASWSTGLIQRSAELTCGITQRHGIPRDSYHIIGHGRIQPWNRSDPGANWPWTDYLNRVNTACGASGSGSGGTGGTGSGGGTTPPPPPPPPTPTAGSFVIDSNNAANDVASRYIEVSASWWPSANVSGYWNTGYWVAPTAAVADPAKFWFNSASSQCYHVEAWWTQGSDRPSGVTFIGQNADESEVGRSTVNQRMNGSRWNSLGTWNFDSGWNRVLLSRWTGEGSYAIADAVRLTPSTGCN